MSLFINCEPALTALYELAVLGAPTTAQADELRTLVTDAIGKFGLHLGQEVSWQVASGGFRPAQQSAAAAVYFGGSGTAGTDVDELLRKGVPVLPVVSSSSRVTAEIPAVLQRFNCLAIDTGGMVRVATGLLECAHLLPRQRRVFLSYRRDEARAAALQLYEAFSARLFDVFLDTHAIPLAEDFQTALWHNLCDADVLVMLDTPTYFESHWTSDEFGRALAKDISVLSIGWPDYTPSARTATASRAELLATEVNPTDGELSGAAIARICLQLEIVRAQSCAVRQVNLVSNLRLAIEKIGGQMTGLGPSRAVSLTLANGASVVAYPTVGVPTSRTLHAATENTPSNAVAVVYDHVGMNPTWLGHLDWLGSHIPEARLVKASEAAWQFAAWSTAS